MLASNSQYSTSPKNHIIFHRMLHFYVFCYIHLFLLSVRQKLVRNLKSYLKTFDHSSEGTTFRTKTTPSSEKLNVIKACSRCMNCERRPIKVVNSV